jgi:hypothetical protein
LMINRALRGFIGVFLSTIRASFHLRLFYA